MMFAVAFIAPLLSIVLLVVKGSYNSRELAGMFLGYMWVMVAGLVVNGLLVKYTDLSFQPVSGQIYGVPLVIIIFQAIWVGAFLPGLWLQQFRQAVVLFIGGFVVMNYSPFGYARTGEDTVLVYTTILLLVYLPGFLLQLYTVQDRYVVLRSLLQALMWSITLFWLLPTLLFYLTGSPWPLLSEKPWYEWLFFLFVILLPAGLLASALYQFAIEGDGTAFPYDPPKRLVTSGVYAYVANPMQIGISLSMIIWGIFLHSPEISACGLAAAALFIVFKDVCNGSCAIGRDNAEWAEYQKNVRRWFPVWRNLRD